MTYPTTTNVNLTVTATLVGDTLGNVAQLGQEFSVTGADNWCEVDENGDFNGVPLGQSGPFIVQIDAEYILCVSFRDGVLVVFDDEGVNGRAYSSTSIASHTPGSVVTLIATAVQSVSTGGGGGNATEIQGVPVSDTAPTDGQVLAYSGDDEEWQPTDSGGGTTFDNFLIAGLVPFTTNDFVNYIPIMIGFPSGGSYLATYARATSGANSGRQIVGSALNSGSGVPGGIYFNDPGQPWNVAPFTLASDQFRLLAWDSVGEQFIGITDASHEIYFSPDGIAWTAANDQPFATGEIDAMLVLADGTLLFGGDDNGQTVTIARSTDHGATITTIANALDGNTCYGLATDGTRVIAVCGNGPCTNTCVQSTDAGATWTPVVSPFDTFSAPSAGVAYIPDQGWVIGGGPDGSNFIVATSPPGSPVFTSQSTALDGQTLSLPGGVVASADTFVLNDAVDVIFSTALTVWSDALPIPGPVGNIPVAVVT